MKRSDKRTTVSLAGVVWEMAEARMEREGYNGNFSAYIAELIRRDKRESEKGKTQGCQDARGHAGRPVIIKQAARKSDRISPPPTAETVK